MTNILEKKTSAKKIVYPLNAKRVMIGLELDESDESLLQYFKFINQFLKAARINCVHVIPEAVPVYPFQSIFAEEKAQAEQKRQAALQEKMEAELNHTFPKETLQKLIYVLESGSPLEKLTKVAEDAGADLVLIGKRAGVDYHVIKAVNVIRMVSANVLLAPENARPALETILVPIDFSDHSVRALKTAIGFKHAAVDPVRILGVHVYQKLNTYTRGLGMISADYEKQLLERRVEGMRQFLEKALPDYKDDIEPMLIGHDGPDVAPQILTIARSTGADLIIVGAKGHSQLSLLLLGSTTEQLLKKDEQVPILVVK